MTYIDSYCYNWMDRTLYVVRRTLYSFYNFTGPLCH